MNDNKPEVLFAEGLSFFRVDEHVQEKMPWLKGKMYLNVNKIVPFMKKMRELGLIDHKGDIKLDLKESKKGSLYLQVNTYKAPETKNVEQIKEQISNITSKGHGGEVINAEDIPFD